MGAILAINLHHYQGRLGLPDREITGSGPVAIVGNGRQTGGGIRVAPRARSDDGLLDVLVVRQISPTALLAAARELQQLPADGEYISYFQTPWLECILKKQFQLTWMVNRYAFRRFDMKPYQRRFR